MRVHTDVHKVLVMDIKGQQVYCMSGQMSIVSAMGFGHSECLVEKGSNLLGTLNHFVLSHEVKH